MSDDDKGAMSSLSCVTFTRVLPGPIERVWDFITDPSLLPQWFGDDSRIEPRQGGRVSLMGGHIRGVVTQWRPPTKLIYTWNVFEPDAPADAASAYKESYPTFALEARGADVLLTFSHFPILARFTPQNAMGWHTMLDIIAAAARGEAPHARAHYTQKNAALYGVDLANLAR